MSDSVLPTADAPTAPTKLHLAALASILDAYRPLDATERETLNLAGDLFDALPSLLAADADRQRMADLQRLCGLRRLVKIETTSTGVAISAYGENGYEHRSGGTTLAKALDGLAASRSPEGGPNG